MNMPAVKFFLLGILSVTIAACKEPKPDFIFFENATDQELTLTAHFHHQEAKPEPVRLHLKPGQSDGWRYMDASGEFDATFQSLSIVSEECQVRMDQPELRNNFRKTGAWTLRIDDDLFIDCHRDGQGSD